MRVERAMPDDEQSAGQAQERVERGFVEAPAPEASGAPVIEVRELSKVFVGHKSAFSRKPPQEVRAVNNVSFRIDLGSVLGLAGESGSGKTVTAEMLARIQEPTSGSILFRGDDISHVRGAGLTTFRKKVGMVFQSPFDSINPRWKIADAVSEPLRIHKVGDKTERHSAVVEMLERVGLRPADYYLHRFPHELSGGELQRAAIARSLILRPDLVIADEPTTMLDVSVRAGILNLLKRMRDEEKLAMLFISHDLTTLSYLCDRIAIMYLGRVVEIGPAEGVLGERLHPYTNALAAAVPLEDPDLTRPPVPIMGDLTVASVTGGGCPFAPRCPMSGDVCQEEEPTLLEVREGHHVACHLHDDTKVVRR
jgi:peptide/nickel transport system ATP-binding protein